MCAGRVIPCVLQREHANWTQRGTQGLILSRTSGGGDVRDFLTDLPVRRSPLLPHGPQREAQSTRFELTSTGKSTGKLHVSENHWENSICLETRGKTELFGTPAGKLHVSENPQEKKHVRKTNRKTACFGKPMGKLFFWKTHGKTCPRC